MHLNVEIKARCKDPGKIWDMLRSKAADFKGTDHQVDTYFNVKQGRLKLREGNIENHLIYYRRDDVSGPKRSEVFLYDNVDKSLKDLLLNALGVLVVVDKRREIYFIDNVKFHIDAVEDLGSFIEIEAIDKDGSIGAEKLKQQCEFYMRLFGIEDVDLVDVSYSDMIIKNNS